jgi:tetratricopeptide (TPR) repeat protein
VVISGYHLERTTNVMFGDLPAVAFDVISGTQINATAPAGFPVARHLEVTLRTPYEVGKGSEYKYIYPPEPPPVDFSYDAAIATWQGAISRDPKDWRSRCELGEVYERKWDYTALITLWNEAIQLEPDNTTALDNLAKAYASNGNFEAAVNTWETAVQRGADEKHILLELADAYNKAGDQEASVNMKNEAERMWPIDEWC